MVVIISAFIALSVLFVALSVRADRRINSIPLKKQSSYPLISIIIPSYKTGKRLERTLKSVRASDYPKKELVVVNDGFDSHIKSICSRFDAKLIQNKKRLGKGLSLNKGVKHAKGDFFLFLDSDTTLNKKTLSTLFHSYKAYQATDEKIGMISPAYTARNKKNVFSRFVDFEQKLHLNIIKLQTNFKTIMSIRGCCLLVTREAFSKTQGFGQTLIEDGDFAAKVIRGGYNIKYEPRALVETSEPESFKSLIRTKRRYGKGTVQCLISNRKPFLTSFQTAICFYPTAILLLAFVGTYLLQNFVYSVPLVLFLTTISVNGAYSFFYTAIAIVAVSVIGSLLNGVVSSNVSSASLSSQIVSFAIFSVLIIPVTYAYLRGGFSGIKDKLQKKPELIFSDW
ncbi:MAG TPA: glycosyltransferase family 2 protein [archaeon]|nr:glycosyltransferase family 2 protein [archaeon]